MPVLFFYGTLMDEAVQAIVLGRQVQNWQPATLRGYHRVYRKGTTYPVVIPLAGASTDGIAATGLTAAEEARLVRFEGRDYVLCGVAISLASGDRMDARAFLPRSPDLASDEAWTFARWYQRHRDKFLARIRASGSPG